MSVDGTNFQVEESGKQWFSHKFKKPGVRYEVAVAIKSSHIVSIMGPLLCGEWPDITPFRTALVHYLDDCICAEADDGCIGEAPAHVKTPTMFTRKEEGLAMQQRVRNRHETVDKRFKQWGCLKQ